MTAFASRPSRWPLASLTAIYAVSVPLALAVTPPELAWDAVAAGFAVGLSWIIGLAPWWFLINAFFLPALRWALTIEISSLWALAALLTLLLVYGRIWRSRVPLFFSSARAQQALTELLPVSPFLFLDVGCGDARVITRLAAARPDSRFIGIEQALLPWLSARLRCRLGRAMCSVVRGDLWKHDLSSYDVVYAYLSPAVMVKFWQKAQREMRPGALLISAFDIPGSGEHRCIEVGDAMHTRLRVWSISGRSEA